MNFKRRLEEIERGLKKNHNERTRLEVEVEQLQKSRRRILDAIADAGVKLDKGDDPIDVLDHDSGAEGVHSPSLPAPLLASPEDEGEPASE